MGKIARDASNGSNLDGVDISVHCDIQIFSWLIDWVKQGDEVGKPLNHCSSTTSYFQGKPELQPETSISILISASFLKVKKNFIISS